jgi:hypothetical protein
VTVLIPRPEREARPEAADYERDRSGMVEALLACGAEAIYEIGTLRAPGLSDLDLVACFPDEAAAVLSFAPLRRFLRRRPPSFLHPPWGLCRRHLGPLPSLLAVRQMRDVVTGRTLVAEQTPVERCAWNVEACAAALGALLLRGGASYVRSSLCLLNGITYNLELAAPDGVRAVRGDEFGQRIGMLRALWFRADHGWRTLELDALWAMAQVVLRELLAGYADLIGQRLGHHDAAATMLPVPGTRLCYLFGGARSGLRQPFATVVHLPANLAPLFVRLAQPGNGLERWLELRPAVAVRDAADPAFAAGVDAYARRNADYLRDMLALRSPLMLLNGGTLAHLGHAPTGRLLRRISRLPGRVLQLLRGC